MNRVWKEYKVFHSLLYRVVILGILLLTIGLQAFIHIEAGLLLVFFPGVIMAYAHLIGDYFVFSGAYKRGNDAAILRSSENGRNVFLQGIGVDYAIRFADLFLATIIGFSRLLQVSSGAEHGFFLQTTLFFFFTLYVLEALIMTGLRFLDNMMIHWLICGFLGTASFTGIGYLLFKLEEKHYTIPYLCNGVVIILAITLTMLGIWIANKIYQKNFITK